MKKYKRLIIYFSSVILSVGIVLLVVRIVVNASYRRQIPALPDFTSLSAPIKEQLIVANRKTRHNPTADNIGMLGMDYHSCAFYDQAVQCYRLAIRKNKSKWIWDYYLGYLSQEMGDSRSASENFKSVIRKNPKAYLAWYYLGKAYQNMAMGDMAEATFNKIAHLKDNITAVKTIRVNYSTLPVGAKFELARIFLNNNRLDEAEKTLDSIIQKNHTIGPVYRLLGNVYSARGDQDLSKKFIIRAKDLPEISPVVDTLADKLDFISRSELYLPKQIDDAIKSANPAWALKLLGHALQYFPENKYLISKSIKFFLRMDAGNDALPYLDKNLNEFKDDFNEINEVGELLFEKGYYSQSIPYYSRAISLKPEDNEIQASLALCYLKAGNMDTAADLMNKLYEKNRNNDKVLANEVDFWLKSGEKEKAKSFLAKLRQIANANPKVLKLSGIIAEADRNEKMAVSLYEEAFKNDPADMETARKLLYLQLKQKKWGKAIATLKSSLEYHQNEPFLLEKLGTLLVSCPDPEYRSTNEGLELSERAFCHIASPSATIISAGKSLAMGYATLGDFQTATFYINATINMARNEKVPQGYMEELMRLASAIKQFREKKMNASPVL